MANQGSWLERKIALVNQKKKEFQAQQISARVRRIDEAIQDNKEPNEKTKAWLEKNAKDSAVPVGFRNLDVYREWRWVSDGYALRQFQIALKFAPHQENLGQIVDGLHELVGIPVSDYYDGKERESLRNTLTHQIFREITGQPFIAQQKKTSETDRQKRFFEFIHRCVRAYEWRPDRREGFDKSVMADAKKVNAMKSMIRQQSNVR